MALRDALRGSKRLRRTGKPLVIQGATGGVRNLLRQGTAQDRPGGESRSKAQRKVDQGYAGWERVMRTREGSYGGRPGAASKRRFTSQGTYQDRPGGPGIDKRVRARNRSDAFPYRTDKSEAFWNKTARPERRRPRRT